MKQDIDSILLANWYLMNCKLDTTTCAKKTELARKYLVAKIQKALSDRKKSKSNKAISILNIIQN